jgi:hypothetical protein
MSICFELKVINIENFCNFLNVSAFFEVKSNADQIIHVRMT